MTRMSKQGERRAKSPRKYKPPSAKTGPRKDLAQGYRKHVNAIEGDVAKTAFIPKI